MEIILKDIYVSERVSREKMAFQATLYINGYKVGVISNEGRGGAILYHPIEDKGNYLIREAEAWCRKLPPAVYLDTLINEKPVTIPMELESYLDNIITAWLDLKDLEKLRRKMEKEMETAILYGIPGKSYRVLQYRKSIAFMIRYGMGMERLRNDIEKVVIPQMSQHDRILNTNIPAKVIRKLGVGHGKWVKLEG